MSLLAFSNNIFCLLCICVLYMRVCVHICLTSSEQYYQYFKTGFYNLGFMRNLQGVWDLYISLIFKGIEHPQMKMSWKYTQPQAIQDVETNSSTVWMAWVWVHFIIWVSYSFRNNPESIVSNTINNRNDEWIVVMLNSDWINNIKHIVQLFSTNNSSRL